MERELIANDYYADLGLTRAATADQIAERYRELAKHLHPDRNPGDASAEATFKQIARAYSVLGNADRRRRYDAERDAVFDRGFAPSRGSTRPVARSVTPTRLFRISPRVALLSGALLVGLGIAAVGWILAVTRHDDAIEARGVPTIATVTQVQPYPAVQFRLASGELVTARAPLVRDRRNGGGYRS